MGSNQVRMLRNCVPNQHALETELLVHICFVAGVYSRLLTKQPETQSSLSTCTYVRIVHDIDHPDCYPLPFGNCIHSTYGTFSFRPFRLDTKSIQYC